MHPSLPVPEYARSARRISLLRQIHAYIDEHLADPALTPAVIAAAHYISERYLYRLFAGLGTSVGGCIRDRRLQRVRQDLADPLLADKTVSAIGAHWGFASAAHFSRVFRRAHGVPPGEYRLAAMQDWTLTLHPALVPGPRTCIR